MTEPSRPQGEILLDEVVPPGRPWGHRVAKGDVLGLIDLEGRAGSRLPVLRRGGPNRPLLRD
jgi:uncharacterized protein YcgI (DUF1989 family)